MGSNIGISENTFSIIKEAVKTIVYDNIDQWNIISNDMDFDGICNSMIIALKYTTLIKKIMMMITLEMRAMALEYMKYLHIQKL